MLGADGAKAELFADANRSGEAARIVLALPKGAHALRIALEDVQGTGARLQMSQTCLDRSGETATETTTARREHPITDGLLTLVFAVRSTCPYQVLRLGVTAGSERVSALVTGVSIACAP